MEKPNTTVALPKVYESAKIEEKWYKRWEESGAMRAEVQHEKPSYTIVIPPPNVTGILHMGHMLNNTVQDVLIRHARMSGLNALWVPGTDHASIATEAKVVQKLKEEGINKWDISREAFIEKAWEWTHKHGGIILSQLRHLGASCDWQREAFTMDEKRYKAVVRVFADLYKKGKIYRGFRMVNWDPEAKTTVSDEEVIYKDVTQKLYYLRYQIADSDAHVVIATTRPETILGDTAVCVHPDDTRYAHLKGKRVVVPICGRKIPVIFDTYVDMEFGTGCLKVTPAHDVNDYELGQRHTLETIDIFNEDGSLNQHGMHYRGLDRFEVRKRIARELEEAGALEKTEEYATNIGTSERTGAVIEPRLSLQWFLSMRELSTPALEAVMTDTIRIYPDKFKNTYRHWMENVRDWCISRQLYWGHRIPAWHYGEGIEDFVVAETPEEALQLARVATGDPALSPNSLRQDEDVLDTWFSSWLWPLSVFDGFADHCFDRENGKINMEANPELAHFYPTRVLVTAPEILFFWVARMVIAGCEYTGLPPFKAVYLTGIVRDKQRRKMSKSLGNSPDPIALMTKYSADGVRMGLLMASPAGNDLLFDESLCEQGRNFCNKIWNALRLVKGWAVATDTPETPEAQIAFQWMQCRLAEADESIAADIAKYRLSEVVGTLYRLIWDDFCAWYLELVKPDYGHPIAAKTIENTTAVFEHLMGLLHPVMPFITEEVWHILRERQPNALLTRSAFPAVIASNREILKDFSVLQQLVTGVRNLRQEKSISPKEALEIYKKINAAWNDTLEPAISKLANISVWNTTTEKPENAFSIIIGGNEFFIPLAAEAIDPEQEKIKILEELKYTSGFLNAVRNKLSNERFVQSAPPSVVELERKKEIDALQKIKILEEKLSNLN
jgi:valyl-tRNA synthetase